MGGALQGNILLNLGIRAYKILLTTERVGRRFALYGLHGRRHCARPRISPDRAVATKPDLPCQVSKTLGQHKPDRTALAGP